MGRFLVAIALGLLSSACYSSGGDDDDDFLDPGDPLDEDGDGVPDGVVLDEAPEAPDEDADDDGLTNDVDTDDDGDGVPDDVDVDIDGDGAVEEAPSEGAIEAAWATAIAFCEEASECCSSVMNPEDFGFENWVDFKAACQPAGFVEQLPGFAQAAATAGAAIDQPAWQAEHGSAAPGGVGSDECMPVGKGQTVRRRELDEMILPYFHGTIPIGEHCSTLWDCEADGRCEGLVEGSSEPGTCGVRPREDGPCGDSEPYCPIGLICADTPERRACERPREENELCAAFELEGRATDNCGAEQWCDATLETPACRPVLREGDPCEEDRQCLAFECTAEGCAPADSWWANTQNVLHAWCPDALPGG